MSWRPENWKSPYRPHRFMDTGCRAPEACEGCDAEVFEAGADAVLEALLDGGDIMTVMNKSITVPGFMTDMLDYIISLGDGKWVFFPDEKED